MPLRPSSNLMNYQSLPLSSSFVFVAAYVFYFFSLTRPLVQISTFRVLRTLLPIWPLSIIDAPFVPVSQPLPDSASLQKSSSFYKEEMGYMYRCPLLFLTPFSLSEMSMPFSPLYCWQCPSGFFPSRPPGLFCLPLLNPLFPVCTT